MTALTTVERVLAAREAAHVGRCHVVPHHGSYTVGSHTHGAMSLLLILHPNPSLALIKALQWHDGAERWIGDLPSPGKDYDGALREAYNAAEIRVLKHWGFYEGLGEITPEEAEWLVAVDVLDLWIWVKEQMAMGNRHVETFLHTIGKFFCINVLKIPSPCWSLINEYKWERLPEMKG